jgi:pimeloyl-ACP methyl ester carboxylesterase
MKLNSHTLKIILVLLLIVIILLYLVLPTTLGVFAIVPKNCGVNEVPDGFSEIDLATEDNETLKAWYLAPKNDSVIILVHGSGDCRESVRNYATMLQENDFGVLAIDMRGHGESSGKTNRYGWDGSKDIGAAINFLETQEDVKNIGGLGLSLGAEVLLGSVSQYPEIKAVVADGATYRDFKEFSATDKFNPIFKNLSTTRVMDLVIQTLSGDVHPTPILDSITQNKDTKFLFIAAGNQQEEIDYNEMYKNAVSDRSVLWIVLEVGHIQAFNQNSGEYEEKVIKFFSENFDASN